MTSTTMFFDRDWNTPLEERRSHSILDRMENPETVEASGQLTARSTELIEAIARGNSVVYLGAGASLAAGLPGWVGFLETLEQEARLYSRATAASISRRIASGDFLVAAEMLQNVLGNRLQNLTHRVFGNASVPTAIHRTIAAIPFSLAITTNYDCLLESAYHSSVPRLTWQNPHDVLQNLRSGIFCVLKLHGDYAIRQSVVLARSHYRDLMQVNESLLHCLRMLLATRTFLFTGVSFSDPDLLSLMDEAKSLYGDVFGPHYAIFPRRFYDPGYSEVLERSYNIRTIVANEINAPSLPNDPITGGVAATIAHLGGLAAFSGRSQPFRFGRAQYLPDPSTHLKAPSERLQTSWLLQTLMLRLGVPYGDVCMTMPNLAEHRVIYRMFSHRETDQTVTYLVDLKQPTGLRQESYSAVQVPNNVIQSRLFLQRKIDDDFALIESVDHSAIELDRQGFVDIHFKPQNPSTKTALLVPIYVDGRRSGVLTLEAGAGYMFSKYHFEVARDFAGRIGAARYEANRLSDSAKCLKKYSDSPIKLQEILRRSRDLDDLDLQCLLYQIDPFRGKLEAPLRTDSEKERAGRDLWDYSFEEQSLACEAFRERRTIKLADAEMCLNSCPAVMAKRGKEFFQIEGPIYAFPVHVRGYTAGVFVGWSGLAGQVSYERTTLPNKSEPVWRKRFWRGLERARRILHLLANEPESSNYAATTNGRSLQFLQRVADKLSPVDEGKSWGERVKVATFRRSVIDGLLSALVSPECGLQRARLFVLNRCGGGRRQGAICVGSQDRQDASPPGHVSDNGYCGSVICDSDAYVEYTVSRSKYDPYARIQDHVTLGGAPDPSVAAFHKVPGSPWIVAPVGPQKYHPDRGTRLGMHTVGYLAGDNFKWDKQKGEMVDFGGETWSDQVSVEEFTFQRFCLDFVSDVIATLMCYEAEERSTVRIDA
ncbi:hypothetical protein Psta_4469 [Pirellula staleyi DSM 6068]|uniref:Uncharacterized protein n=1 Tax=Pirellula staleyi (strain ATCC 27377 / DSM 6068 / ICPB 4128) TaxID=530564 RepID=D2R627_PIRSD|nr:SIR2 family protein [Pirellula staleyi]ADB19112.1 hypothetical protein Psta_4469 [Pirellula staleyi DSM 6068]